MKTWYLTKENSLQLQYGQIRMAKDMEALRCRIDSELQIVKGELDDTSKGVDYFGIIFSNTPVSMKVQEISRVITAINEVESVTFENVEFDRRNQTFKFYFTIQSVYGDFEYEKTFENPA